MAGFQLGSAIGLLLSPIIMSQAGVYGPFVIFGLFGFLWVLVWISVASTTPQKHTQISQYELEYITKGQKMTSQNGPVKRSKAIPPFNKLLSKWPTWALISANAMHSWVSSPDSSIYIFFVFCFFNSQFQTVFLITYFISRAILLFFLGCRFTLIQ